MRWFAHEAERVYAMLGERAEDTIERRLVEFIQARGGSITARELQHANGQKYPSAEKATAALDALVTAGYGQWVPIQAGPKGGRPSVPFCVRQKTKPTQPPTSAARWIGGGPPGPPNETPPTQANSVRHNLQSL